MNRVSVATFDKLITGIVSSFYALAVVMAGRNILNHKHWILIGAWVAVAVFDLWVLHMVQSKEAK